MIYEFQATQSFNGYDEPWAPGAGKNLAEPINANPTNYNMDDNGVYTQKTPASASWANSMATALLKETLAAGTYMASFFADILADNVSSVFGVWDANGAINSMSAYNKANGSVTFTLEEETEIGLCAKMYAGAFKFQIELGSSPSSYAPYANVCMPEGFNIWDPYNDEFIQVYAGYVNSNTRELYLRPVYEEYAGEELVGPWMSSLDPYAEDTTPTEGAFVIDFGGELTSFEITPFMLQTLLDSLGIRQHFTDGAGLLNSLMDQAQGRVRSEEELLHLSRPLKVIAIGDQLPPGITIKPISKDVLPGLPGKFIR